ncbi:hypothetical protein ACXEH2_005026 [Klebsiella pneumoniae]
MIKAITEAKRVTILDFEAVAVSLDDGVTLLMNGNYEVSFPPHNYHRLQGFLDVCGVTSIHQLKGCKIDIEYLEEPRQREQFAKALVLSEVNYKGVK